MSYYFINIVECETGDENPRVSSLGVFDSSPDKLFVMGNLPHGYNFKPTTVRDRDKLVNFLNGLDYSEEIYNG